MTQSADILIGDVKSLREVIAAKARQHQFTPMIGRSHGIHAEPTTFGLKMALMHDEFTRALERLDAARQRVAVGKLSGRSERARIFRRAWNHTSARNWGCGPRPLPPRSCSAICTRNSSAFWR